MTTAEHDTLAYRLAGTLLKLHQNDSVGRDELAEQFGVSDRTIYRDLNRLGSVIEPLPDGRYRLAAEYRGKLQPKDLEAFAKLTGVEDLFPAAGARFLVALLDTLGRSSFLVRGHHYEKLKPSDPQFRDLDRAVRERRRCTLTYADKRRTLDPYRLVNNKGIWYLAATDGGKLKAFTLTRISQLQVGDECFEPRAAIQRQIEDDDDIWFNQDKIEVVLSVAPETAYYFQRRKLLPQQVTVKSLENGGLIVSSRISHASQILPLVSYWIPNVRILEPASLKDQLESNLRAYLL